MIDRIRRAHALLEPPGTMDAQTLDNEKRQAAAQLDGFATAEERRKMHDEGVHAYEKPLPASQCLSVATGRLG